jgi:hypothetical protein
VGLTAKEASFMDRRWVLYFRRAALVIATALLSFVVSPPASSSQSGLALFTGGGFGPSPDVAIQSAIWDAEASAGDYQLFDCQLVGEILIFARPNARFGRNFTAQVTIACSS